MKAALPLVVLLLACAAPASQALAHHGFAGQFDAAAPLTLTGVVGEVSWINPHIQIPVIVTAPGQAPRTWTVLTGTPNTMLRLGLCKAALAPGTPVTITAYQPLTKHCDAPDAAKSCAVGGGAVTFAGGEVFGLGYSGPNAPPPMIGVSRLKACAEATGT